MFSKLFSSRYLGIKTTAQFVVVLLAGSVGLSVAASSASAGLDAIAYNTTGQSITTRTVSLVQSAGSLNSVLSGGFGTAIGSMVPKDTRTFYVNLLTGTETTTALTLTTSDSATSSVLTRDDTRGLFVTIQSCSIAWADAVCTGGETSTVMSNVALATFNTDKQAVPSPPVLIAGDIAPVKTLYLRVKLALPDQNETTINGVAPTVVGGSIQNNTASIRWTFRVLQRAETNIDN
jgi:spore coat-associated protein N